MPTKYGFTLNDRSARLTPQQERDAAVEGNGLIEGIRDTKQNVSFLPFDDEANTNPGSPNPLLAQRTVDVTRFELKAATASPVSDEALATFQHSRTVTDVLQADGLGDALSGASVSMPGELLPPGNAPSPGLEAPSSTYRGPMASTPFLKQLVSASRM